MSDHTQCHRHLQAAKATIEALKARVQRLEHGQDIDHLLHVYREELQQGGQALASSQQRFRNLFVNSPLSMQIIDTSGSTLMVNPAWEQLWGTTFESLRDYNMLEDAQLEACGLMDAIKRAFAGHIERLPVIEYDPKQNPSLHATRDALWVEAVAYPLEYDQERVCTIALVHHDVTTQKQVEQELVRANRAKTGFLSAMSHELRTPLNAVLGFAQLLQEQPLDDAAAKCVQHIFEGGQALEHMVEEVLDLTAIESGACHITLDPMILEDSAQLVMHKMATLAEEHGVTVTVEEDGHAQWPMVIGDASRVSSVVMQLVENAILYNRDGGWVRIAMETVDESFARLVVVDNGRGIAADKVSELFVMFSRPGSEAGTISGGGVGLYMAQQLIAMMGGTIGYAPRDGGGSEFWFQLPVFKDDIVT
ncbi:MAG: ATP-binding protein [Mariprofundales bacterium]|nr:ATP-binding protein [Mariprofundales bacterium]